jgi:L-ascorbate metabolism protein UlaG (beta-lactamase superfamily)
MRLILLFFSLGMLFRYPAIAQSKGKTPALHYFYNSGWLVETDNHLLLFDFIADTASGVSWAGLQQSLKEGIAKRKKVLVLITHDHKDHFDPAIFKLSRTDRDITYLLGWDYKDQSPGSAIHIIRPGDSLHSKGYSVFAHTSSDEGSGLLIKVDGYVIYHAGDHALWAEQLSDMFTKELVYIRSKTSHIDLAFLPAARGLFTRCAYDSVIEKGLRLSAEILQPLSIALQHIGCADKFPLYKQAQQQLSGIKTNWIVPVRYDQDF